MTVKPIAYKKRAIDKKTQIKNTDKKKAQWSHWAFLWIFEIGRQGLI